jgi:hypothetical protein
VWSGSGLIGGMVIQLFPYTGLRQSAPVVDGGTARPGEAEAIGYIAEGCETRVLVVDDSRPHWRKIDESHPEGGRDSRFPTVIEAREDSLLIGIAGV